MCTRTFIHCAKCKRTITPRRPASERASLRSRYRSQFSSLRQENTSPPAPRKPVAIPGMNYCPSRCYAHNRLYVRNIHKHVLECGACLAKASLGTGRPRIDDNFRYCKVKGEYELWWDIEVDRVEEERAWMLVLARKGKVPKLVSLKDRAKQKQDDEKKKEGGEKKEEGGEKKEEGGEKKEEGGEKKESGEKKKGGEKKEGGSGGKVGAPEFKKAPWGWVCLNVLNEMDKGEDSDDDEEEEEEEEDQEYYRGEFDIYEHRMKLLR